MTGTQTDDDTERAIADARARLDRFERSTTAGELMARLRAASPLHPFLLVRGVAVLATALAFGLAVAVMVVPMVSRELAVQIATFDEATGIPMPLVLAVLGGCALVTALAAQFAALAAARSAPLLPHEAKVHQRLVSEVRQLEAQRAVQKRMTPRPAAPRLLAR